MQIETTTFTTFAERLRQFMQQCAGAVSYPRASQDQGGCADRESQFNALALELFALQFDHNEPYRRLCEARGRTPASVWHWWEIPAVPTSSFKEIDWTCLPASARTHVFHSSGTTAKRRSRHFHSPESLALYEASVLQGFELALAEARHCQARLFWALTPPPSEAPHSSLVHMFDMLVRRLGVQGSRFWGAVDAQGGWRVELSNLTAALGEAQAAGQAVALLGTAFNFVHLLDHLANRGARLHLPDGSWVFETGGYKGRSRELPREEFHRMLVATLGVAPAQILCEYGMAELSSQAYAVLRTANPLSWNERGRADAEVGFEAASVRRFRFPPWARARVLDPETGHEVAEGETGLLCVWDLANVWSVMAVQTEDLAVRRSDGFELVGRAAQAESRGCSLMSPTWAVS